MLNAPIEVVLRTLDCPLTDDDRIAAANEIAMLREDLIAALNLKLAGLTLEGRT